MKRSPMWEGFRLAFRQPSLALAEITWRWSVGLASCALLGTLVLEYLDTLAVSPADLFLLRSRHPVLIGRALAHIFAGSAPRLVGAFLLLVPALAVCWIIVASLGRSATLKAMLGTYGTASRTVRFSSLIGLNFLRAVAAVSALVGVLGCAILSGFVSTDADPQPGLVFLVFLALLSVVGSLWAMVNWFLSLASVFVVRDGRDSFSALSDSVSLCRDRSGTVFAAGSWFGLFHLILFGVASVAACFPIAMASVLPKAITWFGILAITLVYFAAADYLYVARLAAYLRIVEDSHQPPPVILPPTPPSPPVVNEKPTYDPDDLIMSDLETAKGTA